MFEVERDGSSLMVRFQGEFDRKTEDELERLVIDLEGVKHLTLDVGEIGGISNVGLRILAFAQEAMDSRGVMKIENADSHIADQCLCHGINCV